MNKKLFKLYTCLLVSALMVISFSGFAQLSGQEKIKADSLNKTIKLAKNDTTIASAFVRLSETFKIANPDTVIPLCEKALEIINRSLKKSNAKEKLSFLKTQSYAYFNIATNYKNRGNITKTLEFHEKSLKIRQDIADKEGQAVSLNSIGNIHRSHGNISQALEYYHKSLKLYEEIDNKEGIATAFNNLGVIYSIQKDVPNALRYYHESLKISEAIDDKIGVAYSLINIGIIYKDQNETRKALEYYQKGLKIAEDIDDKLLIAGALNFIGVVYDAEENYQEALKYYHTSLKISEETGELEGAGYSLCYISDLFLKQKNFSEALKYGKKALQLSTEIGAPENIRDAAKVLQGAYQKQNKWKEAFEMNELYIQMRDSIKNEETQSASIKQQFKYDYEKIHAADSIKNAEEQKVKDAQIQANEAQLKQEKTQRYSLYGGLFLVAFFSLFIFNRFRVTHRQKEVIEQQKHIVEEKQKEIIDSINYAKRIQDALLKEQDHVSDHLPEHFILFKPKDIVSGDFYWAIEKQEHWYLCAADCTGHGVPGAFMSMLGIAFLNEINANEKLLTPSEILDLLRDKVVKELSQSEEKEAAASSQKIKDGMDIALIRLKLNSQKAGLTNHTLELQFAGANNPLWVVSKNKQSGQIILNEIKANKQPIGFYPEQVPFNNHVIQLEKDDAFYIFTDGYADQFGGPKGKKFKYSQFKELVISLQEKTMTEQKNTLNNTIENWRGDLEQIDDVCIIGVRV